MFGTKVKFFRLSSMIIIEKHELIVLESFEVERQIHLQSVKTELEIDLCQLDERIRFLEYKGEYTGKELRDLYLNR